MAYTFGGATSDDITFGAARAFGGSATCCFFAGWWYPTTLTAGRGYCSAGNVYSMRVDTTTDQLRFVTDNTTDGVWTCDPNITVDKWWFIAFASSHFNTGPAGEFRCWVGDIDTHPAEFAMTTVTAPVGSFAGSSTLYAGNIGTGTTAFQGDVGWLSAISCQTDKNNMLGIAANGSISNAEAEGILNRWVRPLYLGRPVLNSAAVADYAVTTFALCHLPLKNLTPAYQWSHDQATSGTTAVTVNGATLSERSAPRAPPDNWTHLMPLVRRAA